MPKPASFRAVGLSFLFGIAEALPYGCGGQVGVVNVTQGGFHGLIWMCSGINPGPGSLYTSGQNVLWATSSRANTSACANYCSGWYSSGMNAGVYFPNSTCECWTYGDLNTSPKAATSSSSSATFLDFYETGNTYGPQPAQNWGLFTCPAGAYHNYVGQNGNFYGDCYPLTIVPGQTPLPNCPSSGTRWEMWSVVNGFNVVKCYAKFAGIKAYLNFSSPQTLVDVYDFASKTSTHASTNTQTV